MRSALSLHAQSDSAAYVPNELILKLRDGSEAAAIVADHPELGLSSLRSIFPSLNLYHCSFSSESMVECIGELESDSRVIRATRNYYIRSSGLNATPNDPGYEDQTQMEVIDAPSAWDISTGGETINGDEIVVAVLDGGFDSEHADLDFWHNQDEIPGNDVDDDENGLVDDFAAWNFVSGTNNLSSDDIDNDNHGTHVSGIIGAIGDNGDDVAGINWHVKILPLLTANGTEANTIEGYNYIYELSNRYNESNGEEGAYIVVANASYGHADETLAGQPVFHEDWCDVFDELGSVGVISTCASKNQHVELGSPVGVFEGHHYNDIPAMCASPWLIAVTNTTNNDELWETAPWSIQYFDIAAPGTGILSTYYGSITGYDTGTSMAAPLVAGTIALMYAAACTPLIDASLTDPSGAAWTMRSKVLNEADLVLGLMPLIQNGRLNAFKSLHSLLEEQLETVLLTGTEPSAKEYQAIESVTSVDYTSQYDLSVIAGQEIVLGPTTLLLPSDNEGQLLVINPSSFACSVPVAPMEISMFAPDDAYCGFPAWVACNVDADGGLPPLTYAWYSRLITESDWYHSQASAPTMQFWYSQDFFVKVVVTDAMGTSLEAPAQMVVCVNGGMVTEPGGQEAERSRVVTEEISVVPNPVGQRINIFLTGDRVANSQTVTVLDESGRVVMTHHAQHAEEGSQRIEVPHSLASGSYTLMVESGTVVHYARFVVAH